MHLEQKPFSKQTRALGITKGAAISMLQHLTFNNLDTYILSEYCHYMYSFLFIV